MVGVRVIAKVVLTVLVCPTSRSVRVAKAAGSEIQALIHLYILKTAITNDRLAPTAESAKAIIACKEEASEPPARWSLA